MAPDTSNLAAEASAFSRDIAANLDAQAARIAALEARLAAPAPAPAPVPAPSFGAALPPRLPESTGTVFYVDPYGSDQQSGSATSPWKTLQHAVAALADNQKAYASGVFAENLDITATHAKTATIEAAPGKTLLLNGSVVVHHDAAFWRLRGLTIRGGGSAERLLTQLWDNARHIEFDRFVIEQATETGGLAQGMYVDGAGIADVQVWSTVFRRNGSSNLDHGIYVHTTPGGAAVPALLLANCVFHDNAGFGVHLYPTARNVLVANCTSCFNGQSGYVISQNAADGSNGNRIVNCVAYANDADASNHAGPSGFDVQYMLAGASPVNRLDEVLGYMNGGAATGHNLPGSNAGVTVGRTVEADPLFADVAGRDFRLRAGSPCVGAGDPAYTPPLDFNGAARVTADLGAVRS